MSNFDKLERLAELNGCSSDDLLMQATFDSVAQGICKNEGCEYITEVEPDCTSGYCEECCTSCLDSF